MKITFLGAGSTIFVKNLIGDAFLTESLKDSHVALYDINVDRLTESKTVLEALNETLNDNRAQISVHLGQYERREALRGADFVINAIQVGGYDPATITDFEIPKRYGLLQTIGDTLGIAGIFRAMRTIPVMLDFLAEMEDVCPNALLLNYTNPMAIIMAAIQKASSISSVGLCHSVQVCVPHLLKSLDMEANNPKWKIAGINHMAWLLEIRDGNTDLYPEIKKRAAEKNASGLHNDMVRFEMMKYFGYYVTESSEHLSEYTPYWIRKDSPDLIDRFSIPLDEYPRRCRAQIADWHEDYKEIIAEGKIEHKRTVEYGADIMDSVVTGKPSCIHGNIVNEYSFIPNLPKEAAVEVPCLVDGTGIHGITVPPLPPQCAALNRTNINVQILAAEATLSRSRELVYQAAMLDPHTAGELPPERIIALCDELFEAHREWLPEYV